LSRFNSFSELIARLCFGIGAFSVIGLFLFVLNIEVQSLQQTSSGGVLDLMNAIVIAGLSPVLFSIYFWLFRHDAASHIRGVLVMFVSIIVHFIVVAVMAHANQILTSTIALIEITISVYLIYWVHKAWRVNEVI